MQIPARARGGRDVVFVSHTSELDEYPSDGSYVQAVLDAVSAALHVGVDMRHFAAHSGTPAEYCQQLVRESDVFVGIIGFRYGALVPGSEISYTELEFNEATEHGLVRLVFLLDEAATFPGLMGDSDRRAIDAFRRRLRHAGLVVATFRSPDELQRLVLQSLYQLRDSAMSDAGSTAGMVALSLAKQDLATVLAAVEDHRFVGRIGLTAAIDAFLDGATSGYLWLEAEAGLGKTALAARLGASRPYLYHFVRRGEASATIRAGLRNLAAQVIETCGLSEYLRGGALPSWVETPDGFAKLLALAAGRGLPGGRLVIIADGLDEAEQPVHGLPLGLPSLLPVGVFVVGTYRTGFTPGAVGSPSQVLRIEATSRENLDDIHRYATHSVDESDMAAVLAEHGVDPAEFATQLAATAQGIWVYARYLLWEVRLRRRLPTGLTGMPQDLWTYYASVLAAWSEEPGWVSDGLPLLATLAVAGEPLPLAVLQALSAAADLQAARRWCDSLLRPMLAVSSGSPRRYSIYHASLRELLRGNVPAGTQGDHAAAWADLLRSATDQAHRRVADHYLNTFGGPTLTRLGDDPPLGTIHNGYPLRHLGRHLADQRRWDDVHALLTAETPQPRPRNIWYTTHDNADTLDDYLVDLDRARQHAADAVDHALRRHTPAFAIGREQLYALMIASVHSITNSIPVRLLPQLVLAGVWTTERTLSHARRLAEPHLRSQALRELAEFVDRDRLPALIDEALSAATAITHDYRRIPALTALIPVVGPEQQRHVVAMALDALSTTTGHLRAQCLPDLLKFMPEGDRSQAIDEALTTALALGDESSRTKILTGLAPHLQPDQLARILAAAERRTYEWTRADLFVLAVPHVAQDERPAVLARALAEARAVIAPGIRAHRLADLVPLVDADRRQAILEEALAAATDVESGYWRARAYGEVAPRLPADEAAAVLETALDLLAAEDEYFQSAGIVVLAPQLAPHQTARARHMAATFTHRARTAETLTALGPHLPPEDRATVLAEALAAANTVSDEGRQASALAGLARQLPTDERPTVLGSALDAAAASVGYLRPTAFATVAAQLPAEDHDRVLYAAAATPEEHPRSMAIVQLAPLLSADLLRRAITTALSMVAPGPRAQALVAIADHLAPAERDDVVAAALDAALADDGSLVQTGNLVTLAPMLSPDQATRAFNTFSGRSPMSQVRLWLARSLPTSTHRSIATRALDAIAAEPNGSRRSNALVDLMPLLSADQMATAVTVAMGVDEGYFQARALAAIAPHLPEPERLTVLATALDSASKDAVAFLRAEILADLATQLDDEHRDVAINRAVDAMATTNVVQLPEVLAHLGPHLRSGQLRRALDVTLAIKDITWRGDALAQLAPFLPIELLRDALSAAVTPSAAAALARQAAGLPGIDQATRFELTIQILRIAGTSDRATVLATIAEAAPTIAGHGSGTLAAAVTHVASWWP